MNMARAYSWLILACMAPFFVLGGAAMAADAEESELAPELVEKPDRFRSVMFFLPELDQISEVIDAIRNNQTIPQDEEVKTLQPASEAFYIYPQFHLKSIVYHGPNDWVIWINNKKITAEQQEVIPRLTINSVTRSSISITYNFSEDRFIKAEAESADPRIEVDQFNGLGTVRLAQNQTFSFYNWRFHEGLVQPVKIRVQIEGEDTSKLESLVIREQP